MKTFATLQDAFNAVYTGLAAQGFCRSMGTTGSCAYRGTYRDENERRPAKCAAGHLLPDELYHSHMEGFGVQNPIVAASLRKVVPNLSLSDIKRMQGIHDANRIPSRMQEKYIKFAEEYNLTVPEIANAEV